MTSYEPSQNLKYDEYRIINNLDEPESDLSENITSPTSPPRQDPRLRSHSSILSHSNSISHNLNKTHKKYNLFIKKKPKKLSKHKPLDLSPKKNKHTSTKKKQKPKKKHKHKYKTNKKK